ncbi:MAG: RDD family protein [Bacteroidetes bacterium]|nr:RDD family protein [Bacteroidota bacterium]
MLGLAASWLYYAVLESGSYQGTLGKMLLNLKVTDLEGEQISFSRATGRFFGKFLSSFIIYIGYIMIGLTEKKQGLHDILAGCLVVRK